MPTGIYKRSVTQCKKISEALSGEKSYLWKGDNVGYRAIHDWVTKVKGIPKKCENPLCIYPRFNARKEWTLKPQRYEWANKDHSYKREESDYISLCTSCHRNYDIYHNNYRKNG